jgi:hypothetical protein
LVLKENDSITKKILGVIFYALEKMIQNIPKGYLLLLFILLPLNATITEKKISLRDTLDHFFLIGDIRRISLCFALSIRSAPSSSLQRYATATANLIPLICKK